MLKRQTVTAIITVVVTVTVALWLGGALGFGVGAVLSSLGCLVPLVVRPVAALGYSRDNRLAMTLFLTNAVAWNVTNLLSFWDEMSVLSVIRYVGLFVIGINGWLHAPLTPARAQLEAAMDAGVFDVHLEPDGYMNADGTSTGPDRP